MKAVGIILACVSGVLAYYGFVNGIFLDGDMTRKFIGFGLLNTAVFLFGLILTA